MRERNGRARILRRFIHATGAGGLRVVDMPGAALPQRQSTGERLISCEHDAELQVAVLTCSKDSKLQSSLQSVLYVMIHFDMR